MIAHLYLHIPFCPNICPYCAFFKGRAQADQVERFLQALLLEIAKVAPVVQPKTIFIGGGTPSALSLQQLETLMGAMHQHLDLSELQEWTMEMNPATVSLKKAVWLRAAGLNRMSMGVQSWDEALLKKLGRTHSAAKAEASFELLREAGFENISLDLIFGTPGESLASWEYSLQKSVSLRPEHLSAYALTYEEDTKFFQLLQKGVMKPELDLEADKLALTMDFLATRGWQQYEISNYAQEGSESLHNKAYWLGTPYIGLGPSAFSSHHGKRYRKIADLEKYITSCLADNAEIDLEERLDEELLARERAAFGLRTRYGLSLAEGEKWKKEIEQLCQDGLLKKTDQLKHSDQESRWVLTRRGLFLADEVATRFL